MRGPAAAAAVATGLLFLGIVLPLMAGPAGGFAALLLIWASSAIVALVFLRKGVKDVINAVGIGLLALALTALASPQAMWQVLLMTLQFWLPAIVVAWVLRETVRLHWAIAAGAVVGMLAVLWLHVRLGDPEAFWQQMLTEHFRATGAMDVQGMDASVLQQVTASMARIATPATGIMLLLMAVTSVFLARAWQARLYNPGGFREEFHALFAGRNLAMAAAAVCILGLLMPSALVRNLSLVIVVAFVFQGLAVVHALVRQRNMAQGWLAGIYVLMILPHTMILLGALGIADNWLNIRRLPFDNGTGGNSSNGDKPDSEGSAGDATAGETTEAADSARKSERKSQRKSDTDQTPPT